MVICLDGLSEKEKKEHLKFCFLYPKSFELIKKEGAITELEKELKYYKLELDSLVKGLNKLKKKPAIKSNKFWASMLIVSEIRRVEKRLKELESKGVN